MFAQGVLHNSLGKKEMTLWMVTDWQQPNPLLDHGQKRADPLG
jgi:hypothetical protein